MGISEKERMKKVSRACRRTEGKEESRTESDQSAVITGVASPRLLA